MTEKEPIEGAVSYGEKLEIIECPSLAQFDLGRGSIGESDPLDLSAEHVQEMLRDISEGKFNVSTNELIPSICIDGRFMEGVKRLPAPASAGGTIGLAYASDIAGNNSENLTLPEDQLVSTTVRKLQEKGHMISVHDDNHPGACGCGACAKAVNIYTQIATRPEAIFEVSSALGFDISATQKTSFSENANRRVDDKLFVSDRSDLLKAAVDAGAECEMLTGEHDEKLIIWNTNAGTRIDTTALSRAYDVEAFVVDAWTFKRTGEELNNSPEIDPEASVAIANAIAVYNIATADQLCHGSMSVLVV